MPNYYRKPSWRSASYTNALNAPASTGKVMQARYAGLCADCGSPIAAGETIRYNGAVHHLTAEHCLAAQMASAKRAAAASAAPATQPAPSEAAKPTATLTGIRNFIAAAKDRGLKFPKLRVLDTDGRTELTLGLTTIGHNPGSVSVKRAGSYIGLIRPDGSAKGTITTALAAHLASIAEAPAAAAKAYAVFTCRCSFCGLALTDAGSVEVGYGPVCAKHWGLPHAPKGTPAPAPLAATQAQIDADEAEMNRIVREGEIEADRAVYAADAASW